MRQTSQFRTDAKLNFEILEELSLMKTEIESPTLFKENLKILTFWR